MQPISATDGNERRPLLLSCCLTMPAALQWIETAMQNMMPHLRHWMKVMTEAVLPRPMTSARSACWSLAHIDLSQLTAWHTHQRSGHHPQGHGALDLEGMQLCN